MDHLHGTTRADLEALCAAVCDGNVSAADARRLDELLEHSAEARRLYIEYIHLHSNLHWCGPAAESCAATDGPASQPRPARQTVSPTEPRRRIRRVARATSDWIVRQPAAFSLTCAALVMIAGLTVLAILRWPTDRFDPVAIDEADRQYVAMLTATAQCTWGPSPDPLFDGSQLYKGQYLDLKDGVAQVTFDHGAKLILKGPTTFQVGNTRDNYLHLGIITAQVPRQAQGFTVRTPSAQVVDLGTEFGVAVHHNGNAEVHVLSGRVEARLVRGEQPYGKRIRLAKGRAASFNGATGTMHLASADARRFISDFRTARSRSLADQMRRRWYVFSQKIRRDPDVVAYYPFDNQRESPGELRNRATSTAGRYDGRLGDHRHAATRPTWAQGRWPGKQGLRFSSSQRQQVRIDLGSPLGVSAPMSVLVSVCLQNGGPMLTHRSAYSEFASWQWSAFGPPARGGHGQVRITRAPNGYSLDAAFAAGGLQGSGPEWHQMALVYDPDEASLALYVNGSLIGEYAWGVEQRSGKQNSALIVGNIGEDDMTGGFATGFDGIVDELTIFGRSMTAREVRVLARFQRTAA